MRSRSHDMAMAELYRSDPELAIEVINSILAEGDQGELLTILRHLAGRTSATESDPAVSHLVPQGESCIEQPVGDSQNDGLAPGRTTLTITSGGTGGLRSLKGPRNITTGAENAPVIMTGLFPTSPGFPHVLHLRHLRPARR